VANACPTSRLWLTIRSYLHPTFDTDTNFVGDYWHICSIKENTLPPILFVLLPFFRMGRGQLLFSWEGRETRARVQSNERAANERADGYGYRKKESKKPYRKLSEFP